MLCCLPELGSATQRSTGHPRANPPRPLLDRLPREQGWERERILWHSAFMSSTPGLSGCTSDQGRKACSGPLPGSGGPPHARAQPPGSHTAWPARPGPARPRPTPPHPSRPPAPRLHGNGRATRPGRRDEEEPQRLNDSPYRHCGFLPCPADVPARGAVQRQRARGRGGSETTETLPWRTQDCGSSGESSLCAGALRARPAPSPGTRLPPPLVLRLRQNFPSPSPRKPLRLRNAAIPLPLEIWPDLEVGYLTTTDGEEEAVVDRQRRPSSSACCVLNIINNDSNCTLCFLRRATLHMLLCLIANLIMTCLAIS